MQNRWIFSRTCGNVVVHKKIKTERRTLCQTNADHKGMEQLEKEKKRLIKILLSEGNNDDDTKK